MLRISVDYAWTLDPFTTAEDYINGWIELYAFYGIQNFYNYAWIDETLGSDGFGTLYLYLFIDDPSEPVSLYAGLDFYGNSSPVTIPAPTSVLLLFYGLLGLSLKARK